MAGSRPGDRMDLAILLVAMLTLAGCLPAAQPTPTFRPSPMTISPSPSDTSTVVWFPPTDTPTPLPTQALSPTPDLRPGIGELLVEDDFSTSSPWQTGKSAAGSISIVNGELTLAVSQTKGYLESLRAQPTVDNYYLEVTASPSLCRGMDAYGVLLRASGAQDAYRLLLNCSGQVRLERVLHGTAVPIVDWTISGQAPPGSPGKVQIGVWAVGRQMRVFLDGVYQFDADDPLLRSGSVGVFARSASDTPVTVSFSKLKMYTVGLNAPPATPAPSPTIKPIPTRMPTATAAPSS